MHSPPLHIPPGHNVPLGFLPHLPVLVLHSSQGPAQFWQVMGPVGMHIPASLHLPPGQLLPALAVTHTPVSWLQVRQGPVQSDGHIGLGWHWPFWQVPPGHTAPLTRGAQLRLLALQV
jgi:hypothetical protein